MKTRVRFAAIVAVLALLIGFLTERELARGLSFDCGCFGKSGAANLGAQKLLENLGMLALGVVASLERRG